MLGPDHRHNASKAFEDVIAAADNAARGGVGGGSEGEMEKISHAVLGLLYAENASVVDAVQQLRLASSLQPDSALYRYSLLLTHHSTLTLPFVPH
jgi:hypothetical protein